MLAMTQLHHCRVYGRVAHEVPNFVLDAVMTPSKSTSGVDGARLQR